jgi:hypothetical protein
MTSTVGVATTASIAQAAGYISLNFLFTLKMHASDFKKSSSTALTMLSLLPILCFYLSGQLSHIAMIKGASQMAVKWNGWVPKVERATATHGERASSRLDRRTSVQAIAIVHRILSILQLR